AMELGRRLDELLRAQGHKELAEQLIEALPAAIGPVPSNGISNDFGHWVNQSFVDGLTLRHRLDLNNPASMQDIIADKNLLIAALEILKDWQKWALNFITEPAEEHDAWTAERLEYSFHAHAKVGKTALRLDVENYSGGHLDWSSFCIGEQQRSASPATERKIIRTVIPSQVSFLGMPNRRFWEFEESRVDFTAIESSPSDLTQLAMIGFAVAYSNDWYVIPVNLPVGALVRVESVVVQDTFGIEINVPSAARADALSHGSQAETWAMFNLSTNQGDVSDWFFLPASLTRSLESEPRERVAFLRDEMANLAWAVETHLEGPDGIAIHSNDLDIPRATQSPLPIDNSIAYDGVFNVMTRIPEHWRPLLPVGVNGQVANMLQLFSPTYNGVADTQPKSALLNAIQPYQIFKEEVSLEGTVIQRHWQTTRWFNGETITWSSRRRSVGRAGGASGLRFDSVEPLEDV
ncbi:MAG: hypothetical protein GQ582_13645, partial [Methyloprofundus sp.]|nr:hypothetical protein [Methyloprofundus sp.]